MSYVPDVKEDTLNMDYDLVEKLETNFTIDKFLGAGGGSTVYRAKVTEKMKDYVCIMEWMLQ